MVLAAGLSRRLGAENKLLLSLGQHAVVYHTVAAYVVAGLDPIHVVVGHDEEAVRAALAGLPVRTIHTPEYARGQSFSLVRGVASLPEEVAAAVIGVGDQPLLRAEVMRALVARWTAGGAALVVPRYAGRRGNPALFSRALFPELLAAQGDIGGRRVLEAHAPEIAWIDIEEPDMGLDIDTAEEYRAVRLRFAD